MHHLGHHQAYTDRLNTALLKLRADPDHKHLAKLGIDALLDRLHEVPGTLRTAIQNKCVCGGVLLASSATGVHVQGMYRRRSSHACWSCGARGTL